MHKLFFKFSLLIFLGLLQLQSRAYAEGSSNVLAVGKESKSPSKISIPLNVPTVFNYKTRDEILGMRSREVAKYPALLKSTYTPYNPIWGSIEDGKPWWGTAGACVFDSGTKSMLGPSEESRFVMNPYLLVAANPGSTGIWNAPSFTRKQIDDPTFPFFWQPKSLVIDPSRPIGTVTYDLTDWHIQCMRTGMLRNQSWIKEFSLVAYNARDFGYNFIYFNQEKSISIMNDNPTTEAAYIKQFIHCGGTCGCPTTCCNNMSPFMSEIDRLRITRLPARAVVYLWKEPPMNLQDSPDMVFLLEFH